MHPILALVTKNQTNKIKYHDKYQNAEKIAKNIKKIQ